MLLINRLVNRIPSRLRKTFLRWLARRLLLNYLLMPDGDLIFNAKNTLVVRFIKNGLPWTTPVTMLPGDFLAVTFDGFVEEVSIGVTEKPDVSPYLSSMN